MIPLLNYSVIQQRESTGGWGLIESRPIADYTAKRGIPNFDENDFQN